MTDESFGGNIKAEKFVLQHYLPGGIMQPKLPVCCSLEAFELFHRQLSAINFSSTALLNAMTAVSMQENPRVVRVDKGIQSIVEGIRQCVRGSQPQALLAHMHEVLFDEMKFRVNNLAFSNPNNNYLGSVLETKFGSPVALAAIYKFVAERLGFRCWGVSLPGHFICGLELDSKPMLIDPAKDGRILTPDEARNIMHDIYGDEVVWSEEHLRPATNRIWLTRLIQNLITIFSDNDRFLNHAAMLEFQILLWPGEPRLWKDLGMVFHKMKSWKQAAEWLVAYLIENPSDPQSSELEQLLKTFPH